MRLCNFPFSHPCKEWEFSQSWGNQKGLIIPGGLLQKRGLLTGSRRLVLSGRQRRAGEDCGATRRLEAEGMRGGGWWRGRSARATQVSIVKFPEELLVLHRQTLVHLWLLLERFLQCCLFCWQLSVAHRHDKEHTRSLRYTDVQKIISENLIDTTGWMERTDLLPALIITNLHLLLKKNPNPLKTFMILNTDRSFHKQKLCGLEQLESIKFRCVGPFLCF